MSIISSFFYNAKGNATKGMYPTYKPEHNFLVKTVCDLILYLIRLGSLPVKLVLRENFGYRYFTLLDYGLYIIITIIASFFFSIWFVIVPGTLIYYEEIGGITFSFLWIVHLPYLSIIFLVWVSWSLWKRIKSEINKPLDKVPSHGYYPGDSKLLKYLNKGQSETEDSKYVREKLEPKICMTAGLIILPIDFILGLYVIGMALSLKVEVLQEKWDRKMVVLDLTDSIYDSRYLAQISEYFQECERKELPIEEMYQALISVSTDKLHGLIKTNLTSEVRRQDLENNPSIDELLKKLK